ncbi:MAG: FG-GAP repeat protein [Thermoanaerobaculia bacterium]
MKTTTFSSRNRFRRAAALLLLPMLAGAVAVRAGLSSVGSQRYFENDVFPFGPATSDEYASALAVGDFNCDGRDDLAIGVPLDDPNGIVDAGVVQIRYGFAGTGVDPGNVALFLSQLFGLAPDDAEAGDELGYAVAAGDFNGDGCDDLAIGVPGENGGGQAQTGAVQIHYGGFGGLDDNSFSMFDEGFLGSRHAGDRFGAALAAGDFDGDAKDDLAIGVPYGEYGSPTADCGYVLILKGSGAGLSISGWQFVVQGNHAAFPIRGTPEADDQFGFALATGRFNDDIYDDLAIGVPGESLPEETSGAQIEDAGIVAVVYGSSTGLTAVGDQIFSQDTGSLADRAEAGDEFGSSLAAGDFNDFGGDDLAIGVPFEGLPGAAAAGVAHILLSQSDGLGTANAFYWDQDGTHVETSEAGDLWGWSLAAGDFDADGRADLAVGSWTENVTGQNGQGEVIILSGPPGPFASGERWHQDSPGVPDTAENGDWFGRTLATGDFNGDGHDDLAVGVPHETSSFLQQGAVSIFYGSLFADGFETGERCRWSESNPGDPNC